MMDEFHLAASFDWETLAPVIFFILYGLAQLFGKKKKPQHSEEEEEPEVDPAERARRIREEIRRRIEERRQEQDGGMPRPVDRPAYDPTVPDTQQSRPVVQFPQQSRRSEPPVQPTRPAQPVFQKTEKTVGLEQQLAEQRRILAEAQRKQKEARQQAQQMLHDAGAQADAAIQRDRAKAVGAKRLKKQLLSGLRDTNGLRKAVLYREILDPPLGMR
jgi:hypothetical protein